MNSLIELENLRINFCPSSSQLVLSSSLRREVLENFPIRRYDVFSRRYIGNFNSFWAQLNEAQYAQYNLEIVYRTKDETSNHLWVAILV